MASQMRVYIVCGGTRGDQQPVVMVGLQLKKLGYKVCMCIGEEGRAWVDTFGFETIQLASFKKTMRDTPAIVKAGETGDFMALNAAVAPALAETLPGEVTAVYKRMSEDPHAVAVVVTSTHFQLSEVIARKLNVYGVSIFFSPFCPTKLFAPYMVDTRNPATWQALPGLENATEYPGAKVNKDLWGVLQNIWATNFSPLLTLSAKLCEAEALIPSEESGKIQLMMNQIGCAPPDVNNPMTSRQTETLFAYSEQLVGAGGPEDFTAEQRAAQLGYVFDRSAKEGSNSLSPFSAELRAFLDGGSPPVYFGWGSMMREHNVELVRAAVGACKLLGKRGVILAGWAHLSLDMLNAVTEGELIQYAKKHVFVAETCDHLQLFPKCCCLITHGGMGTLGSMLCSGKPSIVTPVWWDQNFAADRIQALGAGKRGPHFGQVSDTNLAKLIQEVTTVPRYAKKAASIAKAIAEEAPADVAIAKRIHDGIMKHKGRGEAKKGDNSCAKRCSVM